ncbi:MAG TPA: hypothetical protein VIJ82_21655 [Streptosporangiaceae bacterium]
MAGGQLAGDSGGEDEPPVLITWPWPEAAATVTDVLGRTSELRARGGQLQLPVCLTPIFVRQAPGRPGAPR